MDRFIKTKVKNDGNNVINIDSDSDGADISDTSDTPPGQYYSDEGSVDDGEEITD